MISRAVRIRNIPVHAAVKTNLFSLNTTREVRIIDPDITNRNTNRASEIVIEGGISAVEAGLSKHAGSEWHKWEIATRSNVSNVVEFQIPIE
jgi:hypothetical protein